MEKSIIINKKEFKQLEINANYYISKDGEVYSNYKKSMINGELHKVGGKLYKRINITVNKKQKHFLIHRLVYETWVRKLLDGEQVNHKDDDSLNNTLENLYVGTQKENILDCIENGHRVGNVFYLTLYDKEIEKTVTFCPASNFIQYSGHSNKSGNLNKFFNKNWFKKRYEIIEYKKINNLDEYKSVTTMDDECNPVE